MQAPCCCLSTLRQSAANNKQQHRNSRTGVSCWINCPLFQLPTFLYLVHEPVVFAGRRAHPAWRKRGMGCGTLGTGRGGTQVERGGAASPAVPAAGTARVANPHAAAASAPKKPPMRQSPATCDFPNAHAGAACHACGQVGLGPAGHLQQHPQSHGHPQRAAWGRPSSPAACGPRHPDVRS